MVINQFSATAILDAQKEFNASIERSANLLSVAESAAALSAARARLTAAALRCEKKAAQEPYYGSSHLEEPIQCNQNANLVDALVTRNHYGCLILNAARALFIDVDVDASPANHALVRPSAPRDHWHAPWPKMFNDLQTVLANERNQGFRIYRTAAGFRILATAHQFEPGSNESSRLMNLVGADADFVKLCRIQNSFRARLTPKPWRCGARRPPNLFPRTSAAEQHRFADWLAQYEHGCRDRATCRFLAHVGSRETHARIRPVIEFHDRHTRAFDDLQLA